VLTPEAGTLKWGKYSGAACMPALSRKKAQFMRLIAMPVTLLVNSVPIVCRFDLAAIVASRGDRISSLKEFSDFISRAASPRGQ
jgi:hypothetical protein